MNSHHYVCLLQRRKWTRLALAGWSLCYFWVHAEMAEQAEHRHAMRAEAEALRAELEELRLQLDPHFCSTP